jgi:hypothetical protein
MPFMQKATDMTIPTNSADENSFGVGNKAS